MTSKRNRTASSDAQRLVLDVGGTTFSTTVGTLERSTFLMGLIDATDPEPGKVVEIEDAERASYPWACRTHT